MYLKISSSRNSFYSPHLIDDDLDGDRAEVLSRIIPRKLQHYFFGDQGFTAEIAAAHAKKRGHLITSYIVSSNDEQTKFVSALLGSIPMRVFRMKGGDFFSKSEGLYDTMGIDRCSCLKGSATLYGLPALVFDFGTAITYSALDSKGRIMGGGIVPGLMMRLDALNKHTSALPNITEEMFENHIKKALNEGRVLPVFSRNTEQAMIAASLDEITAHVRHVITLWLEKVGPGNSELGDDTNPNRKVVITGGSGQIIEEMLNQGGIIESPKHLRDSGEQYEVTWDNAMLHVGIAATLLHYMKRSNDSGNGFNRHSDIDTLHLNYIGKRVAKYFEKAQDDGNHIYRGTVNSHKEVNGLSLFNIQYDDSDQEDVVLHELEGKATMIMI